MTKQKQILLGISLLVLLLTWGVAFWMVGIATWGLTPYDTVPLAQRPPLGTWERGLNDFFQPPVGSNLPGIFIVGASAVLLAVALRHVSSLPSQRAKLVLGFAASNFIVAVAMFASTFVVADLPLHLTPYPGYGWTIKFLIPQILLLILLFVLQGKIIPTRLRFG